MPRNRFTLAEAQDAISDLTAHIQELKKEIKKGSDLSSTGAQNKKMLLGQVIFHWICCQNLMDNCFNGHIIKP